MSAALAANITGVSVRGGRLGTHAGPVSVPAAAARQIKVDTVGYTMTSNGGIAQFNGGGSLFSIPHGLLGTPSKFGVLSNSVDAGTAEIREVTVNSATIDVQCKGLHCWYEQSQVELVG
ncbi:MAG TPA: hypothetical protein VM687_05715 [Stenotrophomonas sp.]|nr:hypothetical protein [Stenotrophomonas sp.]